MIILEIQKTIEKLSPELRDWLKDHLVTPRLVSLSVDLAGAKQKDFWLITENTGNNDSSYRIVFDEDDGQFGLECTIMNGDEWYMGPYGSLLDTVNAL